MRKELEFYRVIKTLLGNKGCKLSRLIYLEYIGKIRGKKVCDNCIWDKIEKCGRSIYEDYKEGII